MDLQRAIERLSLLESHDALVLLRSCFSASKLMYLLRCSPCYGHPKLDVFDNLLKDGLSRITNTDLNEIQWLQASLPVRFGGVGVRRVASLAISAYLASAASTLELQNSLLSDCQALSELLLMASLAFSQRMLVLLLLHLLVDCLLVCLWISVCFQLISLSPFDVALVTQF